MNHLLKSIVLMLLLTGCAAPQVQSPKSKISLVPTTNKLSKSVKLVVSKPPMPMIRISWNTEWRDEKGNVQPDAVSVVRSSTDIKTIKQGTIRLVARTNQIVVPRTEQQEFFAVANDYARNYTN